MKKRPKWIHIFQVMAISVFILAHPVYLRCTQLSETKFVSSDLSFENPDQEEELPNKEKQLNGFVPTAFLTVFLLGIKLLDPSSHLFPLPLSLRQETLILRC